MPSNDLGNGGLPVSGRCIFQSPELNQGRKNPTGRVWEADQCIRIGFQADDLMPCRSGAGVNGGGYSPPESTLLSFSGLSLRMLRILKNPCFHGESSDPRGLRLPMRFASWATMFSQVALINAVRADAKDVERRHDMGWGLIPAFVERGDAN